MAIEALRSLTPDHVRSSMLAFRPEYTSDWDQWLAVAPDRRAELFAKILRRWQATRPHAMRRARSEPEGAAHSPPHIDDLLDRAGQPAAALGPLGLSWVNLRTPEQTDALSELWTIFSTLPVSGQASCVGISKAVMLVTEGQIGPALDSQVQKRLKIRAPRTAFGWLEILDDVGADMRAFEKQHGPLHLIVPPTFARLRDGRQYDMIFGPGVQR